MKSCPRDKSFFMGKVTASVSHELQNVLAIIRETAGLMQDFMMMDPCPDLEERLENSLLSIKNQVGRGVRLTSGLNGFAHTADHASHSVDVRDILSRLLFLTDRITRNKGYSVELSDGDTLSFNCDPVAFQTACFLCLETLFTILPSGQTIRLSLEADGAQGKLLILCPDHSGEQAEDLSQYASWPDLEEACRLAGMTLSGLPGETGMALIFS